MSFTATTASLQKRAEEAIRYALEYKIGEWGALFATVTAATQFIVRESSIFDDETIPPSVGQAIWIGPSSRIISAVTVSGAGDFTITVTAAVAATAGDAVRYDYSENVRRSDDMRSREAIPWLCFVQVINLKQDDPGSTYYTGTLVVSLHSLFNTITAEDGDSVTDASLITDLAPHEQKVTTITGILSDPVTLWNLVKPGATNRPISDLGIVAILNDDQPGSVSADGLHNFEIRKTIRLINSD